MPRLVGPIFCLALLLFPALAAAVEPATADALFREGRSAMTRGDWDRARSLFAESQRLEPAAGTLLNLALAEQKLGKLAAAWEHARSALDQLPPADDRRPMASELFDTLDKQVPRLVLRGSRTLPRDAVVSLDAAVIRPAAFDIPLPVDPGTHAVSIAAPGFKTREWTVVVQPGQRIERVLEPGEPAASTARTPPPQRPSSAFPWQTTGWIATGVGAACVLGAGVTGYLAIRRNDTVEAHCSGPYCDATGLDAASEGRTLSTASTVTMITGLTLAAAGTLILVTSRKQDVSHSATTWIGPTGIRF